MVGGEEPEPRESRADNGEGLGFVRSNLRKVAKQFKKRGLKDTRIVFNSKYRATPDDVIREELVDRMKSIGLEKSFFIRKDGKIEHLVSSKSVKK